MFCYLNHTLHVYDYSRDATVLKYALIAQCIVCSSTSAIACFTDVVPWRRPFTGPCRSWEGKRKGERARFRRYAAADVSRSCTFQASRSCRPTNCRYNLTPDHNSTCVATWFIVARESRFAFVHIRSYWVVKVKSPIDP